MIGLERLNLRLEHCRRLLVVAGPELFAGSASQSARAAEILREMERYYESFLLLAEDGQDWLRQAGVQAWLGGGAAADDRLRGFQLAGPQLCLLAGARCSEPWVAGAVVAAWRSSTWIAELGTHASDLAVLAREVHRAPALEMLEEVWERFLCQESCLPSAMGGSRPPQSSGPNSSR